MKKTPSLSGTATTAAFAALLLLGNAHGAFAADAFSRDLTLGSSGSDVTSLQAFLITHGFQIPAGASGYFGAQTKAALASYQAAHHIVPAAGFFGPTTRASVNVDTTTSPTTGTPSTGSTSGTTSTGSSSTVLSGGEATLRSFDLQAGNDLREGDTNTEIAEADFDVKGGDVRVQRVTLELTATNASLNTQPWQYLDTIDVYAGSKKIGSADVSSKSDWDKEGTTYSIDIPVDTIVKNGKTAELSIRADAQSSIDSANQAQTFSVAIPSNGIRAIDAKSIQQYTGSDSDSVTLGFESEDNGKLSVRESSDTPDAGVIVADDRDASDKTDVLAFELHNSNDADVDVDQLTVRVDAGFVAGSVQNEDVKDIIRRATLTLDGKTYQGTIDNTDSGTYEGSITFKKLKSVVDGNDTVDGVLTVQVNGTDNHYDSGATLSFDLLTADIDAEGHTSGDTAEVSGSVSGNEMTVVRDAGINLGTRPNTATVQTNSYSSASSYATYALKYDVTAKGDDVYVPRNVSVNGNASTTAGVQIVTMSDTAFSGTQSAILTSTARTYNSDYYVVRDGSTETFTVSVVLDPDMAGYYGVGIDFVQFSSSSTNLADLQRLEVNENKADFRTDPVYIPN